MTKTIEWFRAKIQTIEIAVEIIEGIPSSLPIKTTFQTLADLAKNDSEYLEILQDRLAGYLHINQPPQI
jgi:hypothetical protein